MPTKKNFVEGTMDCYDLGEAALLYGYGLLQVGMDTKYLTSEMASYLLLNGASVTGGDFFIKIVFMRSAFRGGKKRIFYDTKLRKSSWVMWQVGFQKGRYKTLLGRTIYYGSSEPCDDERGAYEAVSYAMTHLKKNLLTNAVNKRVTFHSGLGIDTVSIRRLYEPTQEKHLRQGGAFGVEDGVFYVVEVSVKWERHTFELSDIFIRNQDKIKFLNTFENDLLWIRDNLNSGEEI